MNTKTDKIQKIKSIHDKCYYKKFERYFRSKLMKRVIEKCGTSGYYSFVNERDKVQANEAMCFSRHKDMYLLEKPELENPKRPVNKFNPAIENFKGRR